MDVGHINKIARTENVTFRSTLILPITAVSVERRGLRFAFHSARSGKDSPVKGVSRILGKLMTATLQTSLILGVTRRYEWSELGRWKV